MERERERECVPVYVSMCERKSLHTHFCETMLSCVHVCERETERGYSSKLNELIFRYFNVHCGKMLESSVKHV